MVKMRGKQNKEKEAERITPQPLILVSSCIQYQFAHYQYPKWDN